MLTCLISCLWLCLAQIYMFVSMSYAPMPMSMPSHACILGFVFFHVFMLTPTCLHAYLHAYMHRSVYLHAYIDAFYLLYAISHVLACFTSCLCAQAQTLFVMPCAIVALLFILSHFLVFWPNDYDSIQTLWSLSSSMYHGLYQQGLDHPYLHVYACLPFSLVCLLSCFFACHVYHASFICFLHLFPSIASLLVSCLCPCMYTYGAKMHGARAWSPKRKQKG